MDRIKRDRCAALRLTNRARQWNRKASLTSQIVELDAEIDLRRCAGNAIHWIYGDTIYVTNPYSCKLARRACAQLDLSQRRRTKRVRPQRCHDCLLSFAIQRHDRGVKG